MKIRINTEKAIALMKEQGITYRELGERFHPRKSKENIWFLVHHGRLVRSLDIIAKGLRVDPLDLIVR